MFGDLLIEIQNELSKYHRDKKSLEVYYIQLRLNKSLKAYYDDLSRSVKYLNNRKTDNVIKYL